MLKTLSRLILLILFILGAAIFFAPTLVSTKLGKTVFLKMYASYTGNFLNMEDLSVGWKKGIRVKKISFQNKGGNVAFESLSITIHAPLWEMVFQKNFGTVHVVAPMIIMKEPLANKCPTTYLHAGISPGLMLPFKILPCFGRFVLEEGSAQLFRPESEVVSLRDLGLDVLLSPSRITIKGRGDTVCNSVKGFFTMDGVYSSLRELELAATFENFPVYVADRLTRINRPLLQDLLVESIGDVINLSITTKSSSKALNFSCQAKSQKLFASIEAITKDNTVFLIKPGRVHFELHSTTQLPISIPFYGDFVINTLSFPFSNMRRASFSATFNGSEITFPFGTIDPFTISTSTKNKAGDVLLKIASPQIQLTSSLFVPSNWEELSFEGTGKLLKDTTLRFSVKTLSHIELSLEGNVCHGAALGGYSPKRGEVFLSNPASFTCLFSKLPNPFIIDLEESFPLSITINPCRLSLPDFSGQINAEMNIPRIKTINTEVSSSTLSLVGEISKKRVGFSLNSKIDKEGLVKAAGSFQWPKTIMGNFYLKEVPTTFLSFFYKPDLRSLLGDRLNVSINLPSSKQSGSLSLISPLAKLHVSCIKKGDWVELSEPTSASYTITKEGYETLNRLNSSMENPFVLEKPVHIEASIPSFQWNLKTKENFYKAKVVIDQVVFSSTQTTHNQQLLNFQLLINHLKDSGYNFSAKTTAASSPYSQGFASIDGSVDSSSGEVQLHSRIQKFPTEIIDFLFQPLKNPPFSITTFLGSTINLSTDAALKNRDGNVHLEFQSPNMNASLDGALIEGNLTLNKPLHIKIHLSQDPIPGVENAPFSIQSLKAKHPIVLDIANEGFFWPLFPINAEKITIAEGFLDCGKIRCYHQGGIRTLLTILNLSSIAKKPNGLDLWVTPIHFFVKQGCLSLERTEILIDKKYHTCLFGNIDLSSNQTNLTVGLTASSLAQALKINNLPEEYVLCIPLKGPINNIRLDTAVAAEKIGMLLFWKSESIAENVTGPLGKTMGKAIKKLPVLPDSTRQIPPLKGPLPWKTLEK
jgi:hypothetical protein